jgi:hypothetical protein
MAKLICTLVCGAVEFGGTLHDALEGPVLAPFHGGKVYRPRDVADEWFVKLAQAPELPEHYALVERARAVGWSVVVTV